MLAYHRPPSTVPVLPRPAADAGPGELADYYHRMLVHDGAIAPDTDFCGRTFHAHASFSPFEPLDEGVDAMASDVALAGASTTGRSGAPTDGLASVLFGGPNHSDIASEDALIEQQLSEVRELSGRFLANLHAAAEEDEAMIREEARRMQEARRLRSDAQDASQPAEPAAPGAGEAAPSDFPSPTTEDGSSSTNGAPPADTASDLDLAQIRGAAAACTAAEQEDPELDTALALSMQLSADADDAALKEALRASQTLAEDDRQHPKSDGTEAGVDIPFLTPSTLLADTAGAPPAVGKRKGKKGKRGQGAGAQV